MGGRTPRDAFFSGIAVQGRACQRQLFRAISSLFRIEVTYRRNANRICVWQPVMMRGVSLYVYINRETLIREALRAGYQRISDEKIMVMKDTVY